MKKLNFLLIVLFCVILISCSQMITKDRYYMQQQGASSGAPEVIVPEEPGSKPEDPNVITMFKVLGPDGVIDESLFYEDGVISEENKLKLAALKKVLPVVNYPNLATLKTADFKNYVISANFSDKNVPNMEYKSGTWNKSNDSTYHDGVTEDKYINTGSDTTAGTNNISSVKYHMYDGKNPFYKANGTYNTETLDRFMFYRFTGATAGPSLDNMLVAVDTYTRLIFGFAKPTTFTTIFGIDNPTRWESVETVTTASDGKQYQFYEYDPAGYVDEDGKFVMADWYTTNLAQANGSNTGKFDPVFSGKSPYLIKIGAADADGGYAVSGVVTVKAKYIKNISMSAEAFTYSVRSRTYNGIITPDIGWNVVSDGTTEIIQKSSTESLSGESVSHEFTSVENGLTLELDSKININDGRGITDYEKPIILLGYDRYSQRWVPKADNNASLHDPVKYDKNFQVRLGETKDFVVTIPAGYGQEIQLCYEISWTTDGVVEDGTGQIFSAQTKNTNLDFVFSGSNGKYVLEYTDLTEASSKEDKTASIELSLANLHKNAPIRVDYTVGNTTSGFLSQPKFNGNNTNFVMITKAKPTLPITVSLATSATNTQTGSLTLKFSDESRLDLYDTENSPKTIEISIIRNKFIPINAGVFEISNVKLKNVSVLDENLYAYAVSTAEFDKRFKSEFFWELKTRYNQDKWESLSTGEADIKFDSTHNLKETKSYTIESSGSSYEVPTIDFSAEIMEDDKTNPEGKETENDVIIKFLQPLVQFKYKPLSDSWNLNGQATGYFTDSNNNRWQIKGIAMEDAVRDGGAQTVTVSISSYIQDEYTFPLIANVGGFEIVIPQEDIAKWCDMELIFDITWRNK